MKTVTLLGISFFIIFFAFNATQQYLTTFFKENGLIFLACIYIPVVIMNFFGSIIVNKIGLRKSLLIPVFTFCIFIFSLYLENFVLVIIAAILLGCTSPLLWISENLLLIHSSSKNNFGKNAGIFTVFFHSGNISGLLLLSLIIRYSNLKLGLILFSIIPLFSFFFLTRIKIPPAEAKKSKPWKCLTDFNILQLSLHWFILFFTIGLTFSYIPVHIAAIAGTIYVGILSTSFFLTPIVFSFFIGKISDIIGRKKMILFMYLLIILALCILFIYQNMIMLICGIILLSIGTASAQPLTQSLIGDITTEKERPTIIGFMMAIQHIGVITAISLNLFIQEKTIFLYALGIIAVSAAIAFRKIAELETKKIYISFDK
jgi:MFS family permease